MTPLRFANPSPPSGWIEDFHLQAVDHARHTEKRAAIAASSVRLLPHLAGSRGRLGRTRTILFRGHLRTRWCLPTRGGPGCAGRRGRRPAHRSALLGLGCSRAIVPASGVCCCAKSTLVLTTDPAPAKITNSFLIKRCPVFAPYRRFIGVRQRLAYRQVPEPPLGQNARIGWPNGRDAGPKVSNSSRDALIRSQRVLLAAASASVVQPIVCRTSPFQP